MEKRRFRDRDSCRTLSKQPQQQQQRNQPRQAEGQQVLRELVTKADFLLENFRPGTMEKWGLGYADLSALKPGLESARAAWGALRGGRQVRMR